MPRTAPVALATVVGGLNRNPFAQPRGIDSGADLLDNTHALMANNQGIGDPDLTNPAIPVEVHVRPANTHFANPDKRLAWTKGGNRSLFDRKLAWRCEHNTTQWKLLDC
jgi:hypothetical protein